MFVRSKSVIVDRTATSRKVCKGGLFPDHSRSLTSCTSLLHFLIFVTPAKNVKSVPFLCDGMGECQCACAGDGNMSAEMPSNR
jgi:hypothetical protein